MPESGGRIVVRAPQAAVWDFAADVRNAPDWVFGVRQVAGRLRHPLQPGDQLRISLVAGGRIAESRWVIRECDRPTTLVSTGEALGASATLRIECRPHGPGSTEVDYRLNYRLPGGVLGQLAGRFGIQGILDVQAKQSLRSLRRIMGSSPRPEEWRRAALELGDPGPT